MKSIAINSFLLLLAVVSLSCNGQGGSAGGTTTNEGTELHDQRPHQNDGSSSSNTDSITSPGSNSVDLKSDGTDSNMQNQSQTHGRDTQTGDNGTGNTSTGTAK